MTVGIAAIAENDGDPHAVVAADRMVTVGQAGAVEYEDTSSKLESFVHNQELTAVAVGSGPSTYIDEVLDTMHAFAAEQSLTSTRDAQKIANAAYQQTIRDSVVNQILSPFGLTLDEFTAENSDISPTLQEELAEKALELRKEYGKSVRFIIAAVGSDGAGVYQLAGGDYSNHSEHGYSVIGSGHDSARLTFIRRQYDKHCSKREALFTVAEAKQQSEERQGVGKQMDIKILSPGQIVPLSDDDIENLRNQLLEIDDAEQEARKKVIEQWDT